MRSQTGRPTKYSVLRDPVHGDVYLTHEEMSLLDTREMQRLRGIKQLGTANLVFPGAVHTRFEHSIGTLHVTDRIIAAINKNAELDPRQCLGVRPEEARVIRAAALLHDITHIPFGHNIEDQAGLAERHDSPARYRAMFSDQTEVGRLLAKLGLADDVLAVLSYETSGGSIPPYWSEILSDTICSDIIDYLLRDAYFTGLSLTIDSRLVSYFKVDRASGHLFIDVAKRDLVREDIVSELVRLLEARYYFSERVYYHHAKVAAGALISRTVGDLFEAGALEGSELFDRTDASLLPLLDMAAVRAGGEVERSVMQLVDRFRLRRLPKRACVFPRYENEDVQEALVARFFAPGCAPARRELEERIRDLVRFATGKSPRVMIYCPAARMQLKEAQTHVRWPGEDGVRPLSDFAERIPRLKDLERSYRSLWKFYVFADTDDEALLAKVQEIALAEFSEEFPGASNVYRL
ncbi:MAG: HD domain-containing protein [Planctomycetota bacterium]|nr:HD domain-containing protein [Planctomycetota bacterium]